MSYCTLPRLTFAGQFQADVSTVNNDVRHYDDGSFEARFQELQAGSSLNGWWNPEGTGAFRLVGVRVKQALTAVGGDGASDPAHGLFVEGQRDRTAAKLVDLDPQFQMGSANLRPSDRAYRRHKRVHAGELPMVGVPRYLLRTQSGYPWQRLSVGEVHLDSDRRRVDTCG